MARCIYTPAWSSQCSREGSGDPCLCIMHTGKKCWCGAPAVKECNMASSLVCGATTCTDHECCHVAGGMTGSPGHRHNEKGYQQYQVWIESNEKI